MGVTNSGRCRRPWPDLAGFIPVRAGGGRRLAGHELSWTVIVCCRRVRPVVYADNRFWTGNLQRFVQKEISKIT